MIGENQREDMRNFLVKAYADGVLTEEGLESCLSALEAMTDPSALSGMVGDIRALYPADSPGSGEGSGLVAVRAESSVAPSPDSAAQPPVQVVRGVGMNTKRSGRWFTSERILVELERSNVILDFSALASFPGIFLEITLDVKGSNIVMRFPKGTMVNEELENIGSNVRVTHRGDNLYRLNVLLRGRVEGTNLRAKTKALY